MFMHDLIAGVRFLGLTSMLVLGILVMCINRGKVQSSVYNNSRILIFIGAMLLAIHAGLMFVFHFRETNLALGALISLACYAPASVAFGLAELNLLRAGQKMRWLVLTILSLLVLMFVLSGIGYVVETILYKVSLSSSISFLMAFCYVVMLIIMYIHEFRDMKAVDVGLSDEELQQKLQVLHYTDRSMKLMMFGSLLSPIVGLMPSILANSFLGMLMYGALIWYICCFMLYGQNMNEVISVESEIIEADVQSADIVAEAVADEVEEEAETMQNDAEQNPPTADTTHARVGRRPLPAMRQEELQAIVDRVDRWVANEEYLNPRINVSHASKQIGISLSSFYYYLSHVAKTEGYRQWIAKLRVQAAKRLILAHPTYTIETIATMCGFSDRSNFTRSFKAHEGVAPSIWLEKQKMGKNV